MSKQAHMYTSSAYTLSCELTAGYNTTIVTNLAPSVSFKTMYYIKFSEQINKRLDGLLKSG